MIIVGIDPGLATAGLAVVELGGAKAGRLIESLRVQTYPAWSIQKRLWRLFKAADRLVIQHVPDFVAIEGFEFRGFGKDYRKALAFVRSAPQTGAGTAALLLGCGEIPLAEGPIAAKEWHNRLHIRAGSAKDAARLWALAAVSNVGNALSDHEYDAICIAMAARVPSGVATVVV